MHYCYYLILHITTLRLRQIKYLYWDDTDDTKQVDFFKARPVVLRKPSLSVVLNPDVMLESLNPLKNTVAQVHIWTNWIRISGGATRASIFFKSSKSVVRSRNKTDNTSPHMKQSYLLYPFLFFFKAFIALWKLCVHLPVYEFSALSRGI